MATKNLNVAISLFIFAISQLFKLLAILINPLHILAILINPLHMVNLRTHIYEVLYHVLCCESKEKYDDVI